MRKLGGGPGTRTPKGREARELSRLLPYQLGLALRGRRVARSATEGKAPHGANDGYGLAPFPRSQDFRGEGQESLVRLDS